MTALEIGVASGAEREWCAHLMAASDPWLTLGRGFEDCLSRCAHPEYTLLVAHRAGALKGFVLLHPRGLAGAPYVASIAVAPEARGQAIGSALLAAAEGRFPGARHIFLCVSSFNKSAQRLYERCGYDIVGELKDYVIEGASEILMHKRLASK